MTNFSACVLEIKFKFGKCNNKFFTTTANYSNKTTQIIPNLTNGEFVAEYKVDITLPAIVTLTFSGKDQFFDTKVGTDGEIEEDLHVQITDILLDGFPLNEIFLHQKINLETEKGEKYTTSYIGFNGTIQLNFEKDNVFSQVLISNS